MTAMPAPNHEIEPSRSAYNGMIVAAPLAAMVWLVMLGGVLFFA